MLISLLYIRDHNSFIHSSAVINSTTVLEFYHFSVFGSRTDVNRFFLTIEDPTTSADHQFSGTTGTQ